MTEERKNIKSAGRAPFFILSIALNLFLIGMIVGVVLRDPPRGPDGRMPAPPPGGPGVFILDKAQAALPPHEGAKLRAIFNQIQEGHSKPRDERDQMAAKIGGILAMEKPDITALKAVFDEMESIGQGRHKEMATALERVATELSWDSRKKLVFLMAHEFDGPSGPPPPPDSMPPR